MHIASLHANHQPRRSLVFAGQLAGKWVAASIDDNFDAQLLAWRVICDVTKR